MRTQGGYVISGLFNGMKAGLPAVLSWIAKLPGQTKERLGNAKTWLRGKGNAAITGLKNGWEAVRESTFLSRVKKIASQSFNAIGDIKSKVTPKGRDIISGMRTGLNNNWSSLSGILSNIPGKVANAIPSLYTVGQNVIQTFATAGSGTRSISLSNPFMTQAVLNKILASFKNFSYMPGTLKMLGDPRLDPWDILTVTDLFGNTYKVPIMKLDWEYDGGLTYSVEAVGLSEEETNADYKGPQTKEMERYYAQLVMIDRAMINKLDVETAKITYASIKELDVVKENVEEIDAKKANIDLANVNNAWIEKGVLKDGSIGTAAIHEGAVTNAKIADATIEAAKIKSINADSIVAGTIKTERLIITGPDGQDSIVKAINIANGVSEAEVNGQKVQAASIDVVDLSAFQAKIAQFDMSQNAIYSGKLAINDPTSGVYISTTGLGLGDGALTSKKESPIQMYADGVFKLKGKNSSLEFNPVTDMLDINVSNFRIGSKEAATIDNTIKSTLEQFYSSTSPTSLVGGSWSNSQPTWTEGKYIWRRNFVTYGDDQINRKSYFIFHYPDQLCPPQFRYQA